MSTTTTIAGLEWQAEPAPEPMGYQAALDYAAGLGDGWRLPTVSELVCLWSYSTGTCPAFPTASGWYWTGDVYVGPDVDPDAPSAWLVLFRDGSLDDAGLTFPAAVRCVRAVSP